MKTKLLTALFIIHSAFFINGTAVAQAPAHSFELQQRNAAADDWIDRLILPQPNSLLTFDANRAPTTTLLSTIAKTADLSSKENTGVAASLLTAHTSAANPHTQYALATTLSNYATTASLSNYATTSALGTQISNLQTQITAIPAHTNITTLNKITESAGAPFWNGSAWPGSSGGGYTLPPANASTLGGIKVGADLSIAADGTLSVAASLLATHTSAANPHTQYALASSLSSYATTASLSSYATTAALSNYATTSLLTAGLAAKVDTTDSRLHAHTNKTTLDKITESAGAPLWNGSAWPGGSSYTLPAATASTLGGVKIGANLSITADGTLSAPTPYSLPTASAGTLGGVKIGTGLSISNGVVSATADAGGMTTRTVITASGNFTAPKTGYYRVTVIGGGGAGGGSHNRGGGAGGTTTFSTASAGGGGGGGGAGYQSNTSRAGCGGGGAGVVTVAFLYLAAGQNVYASIGSGGSPSGADNTAPSGANCGANGGGPGTWYELTAGYGAKGAQHGGDTGAEIGIAGFGGNGATTGLGYGGGGGGGGGNSSFPAKGGWGMDGGASGEDGSTTATHISNGGAGGSGAVILEY